MYTPMNGLSIPSAVLPVFCDDTLSLPTRTVHAIDAASVHAYADSVRARLVVCVCMPGKQKGIVMEDRDRITVVSTECAVSAALEEKE